MTNYSDIVNTLSRMKWQHIKYGGEPTKITMSIQTYYTMKNAVKDIMFPCKSEEETICGLKIEMREDLSDDTLFIVS